MSVLDAYSLLSPFSFDNNWFEWVMMPGPASGAMSLNLGSDSSGNRAITGFWPASATHYLEISYIAPRLMVARLQDIAKSTNVMSSMFVKYHMHGSCNLLLLIFPLFFQYISYLWAQLAGAGPVLEALMLAEQMKTATLGGNAG